MKNKKGFTLVELLAVIVILGILLMIAVPAIQNVIEKSKKGATKRQAELFIDAAKKMAIINEPTDDIVVYNLQDLDSNIDSGRFSGIVVAKKESNKNYVYYIYLKDKVNNQEVGKLGDDGIASTVKESDITTSSPTNNVEFKNIIKIEGTDYTYEEESKSLKKYYKTKEPISFKVGTEQYGIVIKDKGSNVKVLLTSKKEKIGYTAISNKLGNKMTIPTLEDISLLSGKSNITNNFCDGKYTAQADCSSGFRSGYNVDVPIWLSCGTLCACKEDGTITEGTTYCPRLATNGSIHTRKLTSTDIYFMPAMEISKEDILN